MVNVLGVPARCASAVPFLKFLVALALLPSDIEADTR
jgi:hypothetical protein